MKVILELTQEQVDRLNTLLYIGSRYASYNTKRSDEWWDLTDSTLEAWDNQTQDIVYIEK